MYLSNTGFWGWFSLNIYGCCNQDDAVPLPTGLWYCSSSDRKKRSLVQIGAGNVLMDSCLTMDHILSCFEISSSITFISEFQADRSHWDVLSPYNGKTVMPILFLFKLWTYYRLKFNFQSFFLFLLLVSLIKYQPTLALLI